MLTQRPGPALRCATWQMDIMEIHLQGDVSLSAPLEPFQTTQPAYVWVHALENLHIFMVILLTSIVWKDALNFYTLTMIQICVFSLAVVRQATTQMIHQTIVLLCVHHSSLPLEKHQRGDVWRPARKDNSLITQQENVQLLATQLLDCIKSLPPRHVFTHAPQFLTSTLILWRWPVWQHVLGVIMLLTMRESVYQYVHQHQSDMQTIILIVVWHPVPDNIMLLWITPKGDVWLTAHREFILPPTSLICLLITPHGPVSLNAHNPNISTTSNIPPTPTSEHASLPAQWLEPPTTLLRMSLRVVWLSAPL